MSEKTTILLSRQDFQFSAGHYTIFSATAREKLHGHNFSVAVAIHTQVTPGGISFDYDIYKRIIRRLCKELNQCMLLPAHSPYQTIEEKGDYYYCHYHNERIPFLKSDVKILPLRNITVEELARWFILQLIADEAVLAQYQVTGLTVTVNTAPGQGASIEWKNPTSL